MSTKRLDHLKEGEKIYLEVEKVTTQYDDEKSICFESNCKNSIWVSDDDTFYTFEELANDGMPKQGEMVRIVTGGYSNVHSEPVEVIQSSIYIIGKGKNGNMVTGILTTEPKKTELTLAEVEEKLGLEKDSLIIK